MSLRHALLGMLSDQPASGYDLLKRFDTSLAFVWPAKQSQVYGELGRLDDAGLITVTDTGARNRKEYGITDEGRAELHRWLTEGGQEWTFRSDALLRVFFLWTLDPAEARAYLAELTARMATRRATFEQLRDDTEWDETGSDRYARIVLEYGLRSTQAMEDWAQWAAAEADAG